jgi:hypothetical protein
MNTKKLLIYGSVSIAVFFILKHFLKSNKLVSVKNNLRGNLVNIQQIKNSNNN